ncbi:MAG TPA: glycosyltransferase N-terminal domain-containing protein [Tenuifilaceae bacterium]|nr:glycosyltransferase N-terminal domain-containing protein [Tenuifilaceae bacterium]HPE17788.1 glycosyltransferase N-terminal domain-containing protein [Tenuifilaceae bacterium]HPJ45009.1 glycosyltransferase N-terminal domain-containing protein [Tenuifilaceae bacterium]HPQ34167.1 glycosyltransferase N-terminal domain-containing protein [Tenuifilaceae bacterium]HRX67133.1 glycosyltransferase N-terminal domain-containing protein [Tenuifilaceae bacterium]
MVFLYNLAIRLYYLLVVVASNFNAKAKLWVQGREDWDENLSSMISPNFPTAWFHCASLGEFEQGRPLIEAYRNHYPGHKILLTFFSPSGYEVRKNYKGADYVCYLPLDTKKNATRFISIVRPAVAVFIKYEFWHHYLNQLNRNEIPTYVVSAIFRPSQVFFKWYGVWYRKFLKNFNHIFVQNRQSLVLLQTIGLDNATEAGDTRFDRVYEAAENALGLPLLEEFSKNSTVLVAGSTWPKDEEIIASYLRKNPGKIKLIIAPHEIDLQRINRFISSLNVPTLRFTQPSAIDSAEAQVVVIDTIGVLASAYRYGTIAYIGGGFGAGIHNTLEAATFGMPILFGPNYNKFREAVELIKQNAAFSISNEQAFTTTINTLLSAPDTIEQASMVTKKYVLANVGATNKILSAIGPRIRVR